MIMITDKKKKSAGILLSAIGGILGVIGHTLLFIMYYEPYQAAMLAPPPAGVGTDAIIVAFLPIIADFGIISGILYLLCGMGFYYETEWAYPTAVIANIFALLAGFWPFIPAITVAQPPVYMPIIFLPNLLIFFGLLLYDTNFIRSYCWNCFRNDIHERSSVHKSDPWSQCWTSDW